MYIHDETIHTTFQHVAVTSYSYLVILKKKFIALFVLLRNDLIKRTENKFKACRHRTKTKRNLPMMKMEGTLRIQQVIVQTRVWPTSRVVPVAATRIPLHV